MQSGREDTLEKQYAIKFCFKLGKNATETLECFRLLLGHLAGIEHQFLSGIRDSRKAGSLWVMMRCVGGVRKSIDQSWLAKELGLGLYYVELLREFRKRFCRKWPALFKLGQGHFHQDNAPVHNSILVIDYLTKMGIKTSPHPPYSPDLAPVTFGYSLISEAVVMRQLRRWKGCDEGHWHVHTRGLPWGVPEVVGTVQQVHCSRRRLLRRGLEFHACTINKSAHTKKVWKLIVCTSYLHIYIYIYIHLYIHIYMRTHIYTYTHIHIYTSIYIYIYIYIYTHTHIYIYTHIHTYIYTHIYTHTYTHTHTHIYIPLCVM